MIYFSETQIQLLISYLTFGRIMYILFLFFLNLGHSKIPSKRSKSKEKEELNLV